MSKGVKKEVRPLQPIEESKNITLNPTIPIERRTLQAIEEDLIILRVRIQTLKK